MGIRRLKNGLFAELWTGEQNAKLTKLWFNAPKDELLAAFPGKSWMALRDRARRMGLKRFHSRRRVIAQWELDLVRKHYATIETIKHLADMLDNRTVRAVVRMAIKMGIQRDREVSAAQRNKSLHTTLRLRGKVQYRIRDDKPVDVPKVDPWAIALAKYKRVAA